MRRDIEREGVCWLGFYLIGQVFTKRRMPSQEYITVKFYSGISCSHFDSSGEVLENNYAKETQSREPTNIMKYTKNLKMFFSLLLISDLNTKGPNNSNITYQFSASTS